MPSMGRFTSTISGMVSAHQRQEDALHGLAHPRVFHRRLADDGGRVDRVLAMRDAGDVEDGVEIFRRVEAGVVAERAFHAQLVELARSLRARSPTWPALPDRRSRTSPARRGFCRRKPAIMYSSMSGGAGTMDENITAGSVPMATATSIFRRPACLRPRASLRRSAPSCRALR